MRFDARQTSVSAFAAGIAPGLLISDEGLYLGQTQLVRMASLKNGCRLAVEEDADRCLALLSSAYRRPLSTDLLSHFEAGGIFWARGEKAIATFRLLFAGLPSLADPTAISRILLADYCLKNGMTSSALLKELGIADPSPQLRKYNPEQPRVPAGSGRASGQWAKDALSFLENATPRIVATLSRFASRFSTPTAVLGALFIPTPNSGGVTSGTLPGAPEISFERDDPAGRLRLSTTSADGSTTKVEAQLKAGQYVDVSSGEPIGRDLDGQLYLDLGQVWKTIEGAETQDARGEPDERPRAATDSPKLCPAPTPDQPHGANQPSIDYEKQLHDRVNPVAPLTYGLAVKVVDPLTGKAVSIDDCFRYQGDLIDGDMKPGDLADAKGPMYEFLLTQSWSNTMTDLIERATIQLRAADARGVGLKWYFAEQGAANIVRNAFSKSDLRRIVIGHMPPR